jgi:SAM-dependent methyltransferase
MLGRLFKRNTLPVGHKSRGRLDDSYAYLPFGAYALQKLMNEYDFDSVLDVGSGGGEHSGIFCDAGKDVVAVDFGRSDYYKEHNGKINFRSGNYLDMDLGRSFDVVWACHVIEHQPNANLFIKKLFHDAKAGGVVAITVPPLKHEIVGGHLSLWNAGLLLYHIVFAGFDCSNASVLKYGYNISVIVEKREIEHMPELDYDRGDVDRLSRYMPDGLSETFNGDLKEINWW